MKKTVITSMDPYGYNLYGRNFLETFHRYWPKDITLVAYMEPGVDYTGGIFKDERPYLCDSVGNIPGLNAFIDAVSYFPVMCGWTPGGHKIFNDARSGRATYMHAHAVQEFGGKVYWLDSDIVTHAEVTHDLLDELLPDDKFCCYLGRKEVFSENGFIGFNAEHPIASKFMQAYLGMYKSGAVFLEPGWNDCCVFDRVRVQAQKQFPEAFKDLGAGVNYTKEAQHVFINSVLGSVMDHLKGSRKSSGKSYKSDLSSPRPEPYWQFEENPVSVQTR